MTAARDHVRELYFFFFNLKSNDNTSWLNIQTFSTCLGFNMQRVFAAKEANGDENTEDRDRTGSSCQLVTSSNRMMKHFLRYFGAISFLTDFVCFKGKWWSMVCSSTIWIACLEVYFKEADGPAGCNSSSSMRTLTLNRCESAQFPWD